MKNRMSMLSEVFKALGDMNRLKIIKMLASNMDETLCVTDIAEILKISQPATSQHIKNLKNIGILKENKKGFRVFYSVDAENLYEYKKEIDQLFLKAFEKCPHDYSCEDCNYNNSCGS